MFWFFFSILYNRIAWDGKVSAAGQWIQPATDPSEPDAIHGAESRCPSAQQAAAAAAAQHALLGSPGSTMHQAGLQAGLANLAGANHHGLASHSQASANYAAHHSAAAAAAAAAAGHAMINRPESDAVSKGSSSVDPMAAAR